MGWGEDEKREFREGFTKQKEKVKKKNTRKERLAAFLAGLTPEERAERERKIKAQSSSYKDGGVCKKSYFGKIKEKIKKK